MSLINQMLSDLDKRLREQPTLDDNTIYRNSTQTGHGKNKEKTYPHPLIFISVALLVFALIVFNQNQNRQMQISQSKIHEEIVLPEKSHAVQAVVAIKGHVNTRQTHDDSEDAQILKQVKQEENSANEASEQVAIGDTLVNASSQAHDTAFISEDKQAQPLENEDALATAFDINNLELSSNETIELPPLAGYKNHAEEETRQKDAQQASDPDTINTLGDQLYAEALELVNKGQMEMGMRRLSQVLMEVENHVTGRETLALLLLERGELAEAYHVLNVGLRLDPGNKKLSMLKARVLMASNELDHAIQVLEQTSPGVNDNIDYYALIAALYQHNNQDKLAIQSYEKILAADPDNSLWWMGLAISSEKIGDTPAALLAYMKADNIGKLDVQLDKYVKSRISLLTKKQSG